MYNIPKILNMITTVLEGVFHHHASMQAADPMLKHNFVKAVLWDDEWTACSSGNLLVLPNV